MHEYNALEAKKHIGETATVVGKVDCIDHGRRHVDLQIGGCDLRKALLWIVVPQEASGPELDPETIRGVQIAVIGKIESAGGTPQITIRSTTQIQPRTALQTNYIGHAYDKEQRGDIDGAITDLNKAIEHQPTRRDEACQHLASLKAEHGDWQGALAAYDKLIAFDPNKADPYYVRATAKKQHGDFEEGMADFEKAAELRSDPAGFVQIGEMRKERGDHVGAVAEYDKAVALCDNQIAGRAKTDARSPFGSDPYFSRGYAKELKGDLDGAVADYTQAIANNPARAAMAYGARGNIRRARGDLSGAIADYQYKYEISHYPDDKQKLEQVRAEARAGAKKVVVTQLSIQAAQSEQSSNKHKDDVAPESIAEEFVRAYSGTNVDAVANLYGNRIDYTNSGVIGRADVRKQAREYFERWPVRHWSLTGPVTVTSMGPSRQNVIFSTNYEASNPHANKHTSGVATETLIVASDASGAMKIVSQKEQTNKRSSSGSDEETSDAPGLRAAKAEYDSSAHDEAARVRYVTKLAAMLGEGMEYWWRTHDRMGGPNLNGVDEELIKHPAPGNVDSKKLSQLLVGKWLSPRHVYVFRANGTYGMEEGEQTSKWKINGDQYIDDDSRGKIILIDDNYFVYTERQAIVFYLRARDSEAERNQSADTNTQNGVAEVNSTPNDKGDKSSDSAIEQKQRSMVKDVSIIVVPSGSGAREIGNVKGTFTDGHSEVLTHTGDCYNAKVSPKGNVGWIRIAKRETLSPSGKAVALNNDSLVVRLPDGRIKKFPPFDENRFILDWTFAADDKAVILRSMGYHGPSSFVQYDLANGKVIDSRGPGYTPYAKLPPWAKPLADPD